MKINQIEVYQVDLPYINGTYKLSGGRTYDGFDATLVKISTDTGLDGWGESTPFGTNYIAAHARGVRSGIEEIAPYILGMDPCHIDRINNVMDECLEGHLHAKTPIDVACWDLFGKSTQRTVSELLGGPIKGPVPVISSIYAGSPDDMKERVEQHRQKGFLGHSVKIGADEKEGGPSLDAERIKACLKDRKPGEWFLVDANGGLSVEHALRMLSLLPDEIEFVLEAPCRTWLETQSLRKKTNIPIFLDELAQTEEDVLRSIKDEIADGIGIKISKQGGLTRSKKIRDICLAGGLVTSIQETVGSEVAFAALLQLAQTTPRHILRCALDTRSMVRKSTAKFDVPIKNGGAEVPYEKFGLGIEIIEENIGDPVQIYK